MPSASPCRFAALLLRGGNHLQLRHPRQHLVPLRQRAVQVLEGRIARRAPDQRHEHRRLRKREILRMLPVVGLAGRLHAVHAFAEVNAVHVRLDDLLLGEVLLDAQRQESLQQLPLQAMDMMPAQEGIQAPVAG